MCEYRMLRRSERHISYSITNVYVFVYLHIFYRNKHTPYGEFQKQDNYTTLPLQQNLIIFSVLIHKRVLR